MTSKNLPAKDIKALSCDFDEKPTAAVQNYRHTAVGRDERGREVTLLKSLGFRGKGATAILRAWAARSRQPPV